MSKSLFEAVFKRVENGGLSVRYWDGKEVHYGDAEASFRIVFNKKPSFSALIDDPVLALGECYMNGEITFEGNLDEMIRLMSANSLFNPAKQSFAEKVLSGAWAGFKSVKDKVWQKENIRAHYDLGNDFFALWLDKTMSYSCAYFKTPEDSLHQAQLQKIDLILRKMRLEPGMRLLDIGCGWGWLIQRAAQQYGIRVLGVTLSEEQYAGATERIKQAGLAGQVEVRLVNYLDLDPTVEQFDRVVSIGMFEHVGRNYLGHYIEKVRDLLIPGGLSMLHTLTNLQEYETNSWIKKYIFPGGYIPSLREVMALLPDYDLHTLYIESLRRHYAQTLECWHQNFIAQVDQVRLKFDEPFIRMWSLYLRGSAASLRTGNLDIHQIVFSKGESNNLPMTLNDIYVS